MNDVDRRYQEKLAARAAGTTKVSSYPATTPSAIKGHDPTSIEARYQAKLAARAESAKKADSTKANGPRKSAAELLAEAEKAEAEEKSSRDSSDTSGHLKQSRRK